jgi:hypothetical protein
MLFVLLVEGSSFGTDRLGIVVSVSIIVNEVLKEHIQRQIENLENQIREAAKTARFGDPVFSEWYCLQVRDIERLQGELSKL